MKQLDHILIVQIDVTPETPVFMPVDLDVFADHLCKAIHESDLDSFQWLREHVTNVGAVTQIVRTASE